MEKGLDLPLHAFALCTPIFPDWTLRLIREGTGQQRLRNLAAQLALGTDAKFAFGGDGVDDYPRELGQLAAGLRLSYKMIGPGSLTDMPSAYNALKLRGNTSAALLALL